MFLNQNSFVVFALMAIAGVSWWAYQGAWAPVRIAVLGALVLAVIVTGMWARRTPTAEIPTLLKGGQPVLVEYYSDF